MAPPQYKNLYSKTDLSLIEPPEHNQKYRRIKDAKAAAKAYTQMYMDEDDILFLCERKAEMEMWGDTICLRTLRRMIREGKVGSRRRPRRRGREKWQVTGSFRKGSSLF
jgi:hypothetical protein